jgi:4-aminobutyrate aminotransferase/(S)-3-amino-2-methylpropionate transaminase
VPTACRISLSLCTGRTDRRDHFEPVQGEGGFVAPPPEYFKNCRPSARPTTSSIADEVQTGIGRTGTMFAMEQYGVAADLTTVARVWRRHAAQCRRRQKEIMDSVHASGIGGTYNGNPLACAAALAVFDIFAEENLLEKGTKLGNTLREALLVMQKDNQIIGDVRGLGPMIAMELVKDRKSKEPAAAETKALVKFCFDRGLIILACGAYGNIIRFLMPLVITDDSLGGLAIVRGFAALRV